MKLEDLEKLFKEHETNELQWMGKCHDCGKETEIQVDLNYETLEVTIKGGALYSDQNAFFLKCDSCFQKDPALRHYQECEVYSRVVGYLRPVKQWNDGKQAEFKDREMFNLEEETK